VSTNTEDSISYVADSLENDSTLFFEKDDEGLSLEKHPTEVFGDFFFAFTHDTRFQASRVKFPLLVTEIDGSEHTISSGKQFRSEFRMPEHDYYTLLIGDKNQMSFLQGDTLVEKIGLKFIHLHKLTMQRYNFQRKEGRWFLMNRVDSHIEAHLLDFYRFYDEFTSDSVFQQESLAPQLIYVMDSPDEEESDIEGIIDSSQWPVFRPEMPSGEFLSIDFGQTYPNPNRLYFLQCGFSNGMLNIFTFRNDEGKWRLTEYES